MSHWSFSISKLKQIADVLDTSVGYLLGESMNSQEDIDEDILIDEVHRMINVLSNVLISRNAEAKLKRGGDDS